MTPPIIITGMHRSGTSLLASMFYHAGLHLGDRLLRPARANPRGYFEDVEFIAFHDDVLRRLGTTFYLEPEPNGPVPAPCRERAEEMIAARDDRPAWGWKDPRTTLFLDFWRELVPDARFVFAYRSPAEVIDSLRRRGDAELQRRYPGAPFLERFGVPRYRTRRALELWCSYNERIVSFVERDRARCRLVRFDALAEVVGPLVDELCDDGVPLRRDADVASVVDPKLGAVAPPPALARTCARDRRAADLMRRLDALMASTAPGGGSA
ncbi:MAG: hypothetical protein GY715_10090 [Planctomycetes bacterium]|nr:hypothetical protein [Planctomycetota bacterium]